MTNKRRTVEAHSHVLLDVTNMSVHSAVSLGRQKHINALPISAAATPRYEVVASPEILVLDTISTVGPVCTAINSPQPMAFLCPNGLPMTHLGLLRVDNPVFESGDREIVKITFNVSPFSSLWDCVKPKTREITKYGFSTISPKGLTQAVVVTLVICDLPNVRDDWYQQHILAYLKKYICMSIENYEGLTPFRWFEGGDKEFPELQKLAFKYSLKIHGNSVLGLNENTGLPYFIRDADNVKDHRKYLYSDLAVRHERANYLQDNSTVHMTYSPATPEVCTATLVTRCEGTQTSGANSEDTRLWEWVTLVLEDVTTIVSCDIKLLAHDELLAQYSDLRKKIKTGELVYGCSPTCHEVLYYIENPAV